MEINKKVWPEYFQKILKGEKKVELRLNDQEYNKGDILILQEYNPKIKQYTGREIKKKISYLIKTKELGFWNKEDIDKYGFIILQLD